MSTSSVNQSTGAERRQVAAAASESITYSVVPRLLNLAAEQATSSYRPGVQKPPAGQQKQRVVGRMLKVSKLAAMIGRGKANMRRRQADSSPHTVDFVDSRPI